MNPAPCILAFTDPFKADVCAKGINLVDASGAGILIQAPTREAAAWMLGLRRDGVEWACFNFGPTSENFALYFDTAEAMLRR